MPRRKKYGRRPYRRSKRRKPRMSRLQTLTVRQPGNILPDRLKTTLIYEEKIQVNPAGLTGGYNYNLNSLYDPNRAGTGHQPMGFDELAGLYNRYRVHGCAYEVTWSNFNTPVRVGVCPLNGSSNPADVDDLSEQPYSSTTIVGTIGSGGNDIRRLKGYIGMKKLMGRTILDDRDEAVVTASPSEVAILSLLYESLDGSTAMTSANHIVRLKYYVEFFDKKSLVGS